VKSDATAGERNARKFTVLGLGQTLLALLLLTFFLSSTMLGAVALWRIDGLVDNARQQSVENGQILTRLVDCTDPAGTCYRVNNAGTGRAIASINDVTIAAGFCAKTLPRSSTREQYRLCIERELTKGK
jgi:hypothetical protein